MKKTTTTKRKTVNVTTKTGGYTVTATQDITVSNGPMGKTKTAGATRFALIDKAGNLVATTGNKKLTTEKFNKKFVKETALTVMPTLKKLVNTGEITL